MNLIYLAKPVYGGWVTFTAHLSLKYDYPIYKISKRNEKFKRKFGYSVKYQNQDAEAIRDLQYKEKFFITCCDKNYYKYLYLFDDNTKIVIHDPTEVTGKKALPILEHLRRFDVITIRPGMTEYLKQIHGIESTYKPHPFYEYTINELPKVTNVSISRIDFDKHTDIIIKANNLLRNDDEDATTIDIYGAKNDLYCYHKLTKEQELNLQDFYYGNFKKDFSELDKILSEAKYCVDLSAIKNDGGGTQYTFLEAIYQGAILILNKKWITKDSIFIPNENCLVVTDENDLYKLLQSDTDYSHIRHNAYKLLEPHITVQY